MNKVLILRGLQGSGKSEFAYKWVAEDPQHRIRLNRGDIRRMLGNNYVPEREEFVTYLYWSFLAQATAGGYDIVIDQMNLDDKYIEEVKDFIEETNEWADNNLEYEVEVKDFFNVPLQTCIDRDAQSDHPVGESVIRNTYNRYKDKIAPWKYLN